MKADGTMFLSVSTTRPIAGTTCDKCRRSRYRYDNLSAVRRDHNLAQRGPRRACALMVPQAYGYGVSLLPRCHFVKRVDHSTLKIPLESLITAVTGSYWGNTLGLWHGALDGRTRDFSGCDFCRPLARAHCHFCCPGAPLQTTVNGSTEKLLLIMRFCKK